MYIYIYVYIYIYIHAYIARRAAERAELVSIATVMVFNTPNPHPPHPNFSAVPKKPKCCRTPDASCSKTPFSSLNTRKARLSSPEKSWILGSETSVAHDQ